MKNMQLGIHELPYEYLQDPFLLDQLIYTNMYKNYYWSSDFSPHYYIAQAKAGFIAVTDTYEEQEFLLPEIQFSYAILDFKDLHISRKVKKLLKSKNIQLEITLDPSEVAMMISRSHKNSWLSKSYLNILKATQGIDENFQIISVGIRDNGELVAGELGYVIGKTYTSLSGFSSKEKCYRNYGNTQLVLLAQHLKTSGFSFWNLGQSYMTYKLALGAKVYERKAFLTRWLEASQSFKINDPRS